MKRQMKFKTKIMWAAILVALIPLMISYWIFIEDQLGSMDARIRTNLKEVAFSIKNTPIVQDKLADQENDLSLQYYTQGLIQNLQDVDIIVLADMKGEKYSHLDEEQIGQVFVGEDKWGVLNKGTAYYSLNKGSMGETLRWFEPVMKDGSQVGFVMVGKYFTDIYEMNQTTKARYMLLFLVTGTMSLIMASLLANRIKKAILDMEPHEIARLYLQKEEIFNGVQEGIIALDGKHQLLEANQNAQQLLKTMNSKALISVIHSDLDKREAVSFKEYVIGSKKVFVSLQPMWQQNHFLGTIITIMDEQEIGRVAKEITGIEEVNKNLRATVHEFKNNLHVILGLLQLGEYDEAKAYIMRLQETKKTERLNFAMIEDHYIRALLLSRTVMAKEKKINMQLTDHSHLESWHGCIDSQDLVTIVGNLLENAFEACMMSDSSEKKVSIGLKEDKEHIIIRVKDNGIPIPKEMKENLFELGVSSKGKNRGNGLYLIKNNVTFYQGKVTVEELETGEKEFSVILSKEQRG